MNDKTKTNDAALVAGLNRPLRPGEHHDPAAPGKIVQPLPSKDGHGLLTKEVNPSGAVDQTIRRDLLEFKVQRKLTNKQLAKLLGQSSPTIVSAYLNSNPRGNWLQLQAKAKDMLDAEQKRKTEGALPLRETPVSRQIFGVLELIRSTGDFGLAHGPAGAGKSCGTMLYAERYPNTTLTVVSEWKKDTSGLVTALMQVAGQGWDQKTPRGIFLEERFKGSNRLIIVDNAQRMTASSLAWLFDFHDATGCPVCLVGNPSVLEKVRANDQFFSRIGICEEVKPRTIAESEEFAKVILEDLAPELISEIGAEAAARVHSVGHARALKKQVSLTKELLKTPQFAGKSSDAFAAARRKLVTAETGKELR